MAVLVGKPGIEACNLFIIVLSILWSKCSFNLAFFLFRLEFWECGFWRQTEWFWDLISTLHLLSWVTLGKLFNPSSVIMHAIGASSFSSVVVKSHQRSLITDQYNKQNKNRVWNSGGITNVGYKDTELQMLLERWRRYSHRPTQENQMCLDTFPFSFSFILCNPRPVGVTLPRPGDTSWHPYSLGQPG